MRTPLADCTLNGCTDDHGCGPAGGADGSLLLGTGSEQNKQRRQQQCVGFS
jgi:hypothetical protein